MQAKLIFSRYAETMPGLNMVRDVLFAHKKLLVIAILCLFLGTCIDVGLVVAIKSLLDSFQANKVYSSGYNPLYISGIVMSAVIVRELISVLQNHRLALLTYNIGASIKRRIVINHRSLNFDALQNISKNFILTLFRNVDDVVDFTKQGLIVVIRELMTLVGTIIAMLCLNFTLALSFILVTPLAFCFMKSIGKKSKKSAVEALNARNMLNQHVMHGHEHWIAFHTNKLARDDYFSSLSLLLASYKANGISLIMGSVWLSMLTQFWIGVMLAVIVYLMLTGAMGVTTGTMMAFLYAIARLRSPAKRIADLRSIYDQAVTSANSINDFVGSTKEFTHCHQARPVDWQKIRFHEVMYSDIFRVALNCSFNKGEKVLIIGDSGVGKSTFLHLMAMLHKPKSGAIFLDDEKILSDIRDSWFESMVYVDQFSGLLCASMRDNLTAFAFANDEMCNDVLVRVGLADWLAANSLDCIIGDGGKPLSGGERQRVILARIMLQCTGKSVVLLDEVFAALDEKSVFNMTKILLEYLDHALVITVSHQLNTYELYDKIMTMEKTSGLIGISHEKFAEMA